MREQHARQLDRWIDLLAQLHGLPRVVMLRQFRVMPHLEMAVARLVAAHPPEECAAVEERYGTVERVPRDQQTKEERQRRDEETNKVLAALKQQQQYEAQP